MTKHYCDRCGLEHPTLTSVRIPIENLNNGSFRSCTIEVCPICEREHEHLEDMLIDFKIMVFEKFFKVKGE